MRASKFLFNKVSAALAVMLCATLTFGQNKTLIQDSGKIRKNTIRYNLSGALLFGGGYTVFGYERLLKNNQSISINLGPARIRKFTSIDLDSLDITKDGNSTGFNVSVDYRFYLKKENKYAAPRGVYIGPYYSFVSFGRENEWQFNNVASGAKTASTDTKFNIHSFGFELGYQFVFWKRFSLDLVLIGPGYALYDLTSKVNTNLTEEEKQQLYDAILEVYEERFPGSNLIIDGDEFKANGGFRTWTFGYRYIVQIGFRF